MPSASAGSPIRVLLTGGGGFVAPYFVRALRAQAKAPCEILATGRKAEDIADIGRLVALDITDARAVNETVAAFRPSVILHLAGVSDLAAAQANPVAAWAINVEGTLNFARAALEHVPQSSFLFAGSCQVYGASAAAGQPLTEDHVLAPISEYGATKAAADLALGALAARGLRTIRFRPFNHIGTGQSDAFAIPSFAAQIARIERKLQLPVIKVGNLEAERDFLDVRDVANAYAQAAMLAETIEPGTILNLASGHPIRMRKILDTLIALSGANISVEIDQARWRPNELPLLVGNADKARAMLCWQPQCRIEDTLRAVLDDQRKRAHPPT